MNPISEIIVPFVSKYDVPFKYDEAIGKLWQIGCFEDPKQGASEDIVRIASFVGACYCAMIREDVYLHLAEGLQLIRRSRYAWDTLKQHLPSEDLDEIHHRYILARWQDARGRLLYRTGNYTLARTAFLKALEIAGNSDKSNPNSALYWCYSDIKSNLERTSFEIARQFGDYKAKGEEVRRKLSNCIEWTESKVKSEGSPF